MSDSLESGNDTSVVAFLIDSPMQAWGASSRFQYRETEAFPTKSALLGLVAAAMGIDKHATDEIERLAPLAGLRATVCACPRARSTETLRLTDFHTIGGGWDRKNSHIEKLNIPRKASGLPFGTVITRRTYLTDARFLAALEGANTTVHAVSEALADPLWGIWFGRKTCLPALPLAPTVAPNVPAAFESLLERLGEWEDASRTDHATFERWEEPANPETTEGDFFLNDVPISFGDRTYTVRPVRRHRPVCDPEGRL